jgi:hypothetical protein
MILKENALKYRLQYEQLTKELIKFLFTPTFNQ